ncbi:NYN domain-containing protein [Actinopolymorpha pittospori]
MLVDAGYLLGAAAALLDDDADRAALSVDYPALIGTLIEEAEKQTSLPILRVLWYDGAIKGRPTPEHQALGLLPNVKVRLGETVWRHGRLEQKGVDSFLQRDLATLARNRAVCDVVLIGGDEDLRRGLEEAQDFGVRVHLWAVEAARVEYNQSQALIAEADRRWVLPAKLIARFVQLKSPGALASPSAVPSTSSPLHPEPAVVVRPAGSPADLAKLSSATSSVPFGPSERPASRRRVVAVIPKLEELSTPAQADEDREADAADPPSDATQVGRRFGDRWASRASRDHLDALLRSESVPNGIPNYLDGELLRYAEGLGVPTRDDEGSKIAIRQGFWSALRRAAAYPVGALQHGGEDEQVRPAAE